MIAPSRHPAFRAAIVTLAAFLSLSAMNAQTVEWSGTGTNNALGQAANWVGGVAPASGADIRIATGNFASPDTLSFNADRTLGSITFDNGAGQFPSLVRLNANVGNGTTTRNGTLNSSNGTILSVVNGANVFISGNSSTLANFAGLNLFLNYSGTAAIHVDTTSTLAIGGNAANFKAVSGQNAGLVKTGGGTLTLGGGASNYTGGFTLAEGTVLVSGSSNTTAGHANQGMGPFGYGTLTLAGGTKLASSAAAASNGNRTLDNAVNFTGGTVNLGDATNDGSLVFIQGVNTGDSTLSGNTVLNLASTVTFNRTLTGSGSLTKTGAGTLNLNQQASYTGGTILQGGQLQMGADNLPVNGAVTFDGGTLRVGNTGFTADGHATTLTANGGTFSIAGTNVVTWGGNISGAGTLTMTGSTTAALVLTGTNTYTGGTTISAGTVRGSVGTGNLTIDTGGVYDLHGADRSTGALSGSGNITLGEHTLTTSSSAGSSFAGVISGTGGLTKSGTGALTLSGPNDYTGATAVTAGTLTGSIGTGGLSVSTGATYGLGGVDRVIPVLSGAGTVSLGANTLTTGDSANHTFAGAITGTGGLVKQGAGTVALTGTSTYTGVTQVNAGELRVDGTLASAVTVGGDASLSGRGTLNGLVTIAGTHSPGNSAGIQNFTDLTYLAGSTLKWELYDHTINQGANPNAAYDQIFVSGTLSFAGATALDLSFNGLGSTINWTDPFWNVSRYWLIFDATSTLNAGNLTLNAFNWLDSAGNAFGTALPGSTFELAHVGDGVLLTFVAVPEPGTYALMILGIGLLALFRLRRRQA